MAIDRVRQEQSRIKQEWGRLLGLADGKGARIEKRLRHVKVNQIWERRIKRGRGVEMDNCYTGGDMLLCCKFF